MSFIKKLMFLFIALYTTACSAGSSHEDFSQYWTDFRMFVIEGNYQKLAEMTKLPLEVKGVTDFIPSKYYEAEQLDKAFEQLMSQLLVSYENGKSVDRSLREIVKEKVHVEEKPDAAGMIRVEQFVFQKIDGQWTLVRAYLEE